MSKASQIIAINHEILYLLFISQARTQSSQRSQSEGGGVYYHTADEATGEEDNPPHVSPTEDPTASTHAEETEKDSDSQFQTPKKKTGHQSRSKGADAPLPRRSPRKAMLRQSEDERSSGSRKRGVSTGSSSEDPASGRKVILLEFS